MNPTPLPAQQRQHLRVQEQQGRQSLISCTRRHPVAAREITEKALHFHAAYFQWMTHAVGADMAANPVRTSPFGRQTAVLKPQSSANFAELARPTRLRIGVVYDCKFTGILHRAVSLPDNTLNVSPPVAVNLRAKLLSPVEKVELTSQPVRQIIHAMPHFGA